MACFNIDPCGSYDGGGAPDYTDAKVEVSTSDGDIALDPQFSQVEEDSIQMDINRESLKRKLLLRRTLPELVDQGIYPPLNVPPAYADRQKHLQRAQTGDRLRQKLKERPDRDCLVQHHILEDTSVLVDRSLQDKQRLLKRSRLQSDLSGRLASRPGPLELVTKNILETDPQLKDGLIEGKIQFTRTTEVDDPVRRHLISGFFDFEDLDEDCGLNFEDSCGVDFSALVTTSDDSLPDSICLTPTDSASESTLVGSSSFSSPPDSANIFSLKTSVGSTTKSNIPPAPDITPLLQGGKRFQFVSATFPPAPVFSLAPSLQQASVLASTASPSSNVDLSGSSDSLGSVSVMGSSSKRIGKKSKTKNVTKTKVIKFHEYKGPPNTVKASVKSRPPEPAEESVISPAYSILLEQQQLFLQWQLRFQQQTLLSRQQSESALSVTSTATASQVTQIPQCGSFSLSSVNTSAQALSTAASGVFGFKPSQPITVSKLPPTRLEDLKVADLKSECKRLNLPSNGAKQQLIERLLPHFGKILGISLHSKDMTPATRTSDSSSGTSEVTSPVSTSFDVPFGTGFMASQNSVVPMSVDVQPTRPSSIVPMDVDQNSSQNPGGYICTAPATIILLQPGHPRMAQPAESQTLPVLRHETTNMQQMRQQKLAARNSLPETSSFSTSAIGTKTAQPFMFVARPVLDTGVNQTRPEEQQIFTTNPKGQSSQPARERVRPNSSISSDELVLRQQYVIAELEHSLQKYQEELIQTKQKARLKELQLTSRLSSLSQDSMTYVPGMMSSDIKRAVVQNNTSPPLAKDLGVAMLPKTNGVNNHAVYGRKSSQNEVPVIQQIHSATHNSLASFDGSLPSQWPLFRSSTDPRLLASSTISSSVDSTTSSINFCEPNLSFLSGSSTAPAALFFSPSSQNTAMDDLMEVLFRRDELSVSESGSDRLLHRDSDVSSSNIIDTDNKPLFILPTSAMEFNGLKQTSELPLQSNRMVVDSSSLAADDKGSCVVVQDSTYLNDDMDSSDGQFSLGNMEWSNFEYDLMKKQPYESSEMLLDSQLSDVGNPHFAGSSSVLHIAPEEVNKPSSSRHFDLMTDVGNNLEFDWLGGNIGVSGSESSFSLVGQVAGTFGTEDYLSMPKPNNTLDFYNFDDSDLCMTSDMTMTFEKLVEAQPSKT